MSVFVSFTRREKIEKLLEELLKAEKYIFLEFFIVEQGQMWDAILEILKDKVRADVDVWLIYDDFVCFFLLPKNFAKRLEAMEFAAAFLIRFSRCFLRFRITAIIARLWRLTDASLLPADQWCVRCGMIFCIRLRAAVK